MTESEVKEQQLSISALLGSDEQKEVEYEKILDLVRAILSLEDQWQEIQRSDVLISRLVGGITNQLLLVEKRDAKNEKDKVCVRIYGEATSNFVNRNFENLVFAKLSSVGFATAFYGVFGNGRIEGYLPGRSLTPDEMPTEPINRNIAKAVATLHSFHYPDIQYLSSLKFDELRDVDYKRLAEQHEIPEFDHLQWIWNKVGLFFSLSKDLHFPTTKQQEQYTALRVPEMYEEFCLFRKATEELHDKLKQWKDDNNSDIEGDLTRDRLLGRLYGLDEVFCHNDLLSGNVMLVKKSEESSEEEIRLIDYEYAGYNYRAYDIASHFCECCGFEFETRNEFPNHERRLIFLQSYLDAIGMSGSSSEFVQGFEDILLYFTMLAHLFCGSWSIAQSKGSSIDFDYLHYASIRFEEYYHQKEQYFKKLFHSLE